MPNGKVFLLLSVNLDKIPADKVRKFTRRNGDIGMAVAIEVRGRAEPSQYGQNITITLAKGDDKESPTVFIGNGKGYGNIDEKMRIEFEFDPLLIPKDKRKTFTYKDGSKGSCANLVAFERQQRGEWGGDFSLALAQTKEEREKNTPNVYIGNGKFLSRAAESSIQTPDENDDLPF